MHTCVCLASVGLLNSWQLKARGEDVLKTKYFSGSMLIFFCLIFCPLLTCLFAGWLNTGANCKLHVLESVRGTQLQLLHIPLILMAG